MTTPDPAELERVRRQKERHELIRVCDDIRYMTNLALTSTNDLKALKRLQTSLTRWLHVNHVLERSEGTQERDDQ